MSEAVAEWFAGEGSIRERVERVGRIHRDLIVGYQRDFGKYTDKLRTQHIDAVFASVPRQLAACQDDSVQRFRFRDVVERKRRYQELRGPIDWLETTKLVRKCYPIKGRPQAPLWAQARQNIFKLYLFDVGLLGYMLGLRYSDQQAQSLSFKGYIAENFVQNELSVRVAYPTFGWEQTGQGPSGVSPSRPRWRSHPCRGKKRYPHPRSQLAVLRGAYQPRCAIKLSGGPGGEGEGLIEIWPLYYAQHLRDL